MFSTLKVYWGTLGKEKERLGWKFENNSSSTQLKGGDLVSLLLHRKNLPALVQMGITKAKKK